MIRDRLAAFLYWAAYWLNQAADRLWYGKEHRINWSTRNETELRRLQRQHDTAARNLNSTLGRARQWTR